MLYLSLYFSFQWLKLAEKIIILKYFRPIYCSVLNRKKKETFQSKVSLSITMSFVLLIYSQFS